MKKLFLIYTLLCMVLFVKNSDAQAIRVRIPDTTGLVIGNIVDIPVYVDSSLTGKNVTSYQFSILFSGSNFTLLDINTTGTVSSSLGAPVYSFNNYQQSTFYRFLQVAVAGTTPIVGKGKLFNIRVRINAAGTITGQFLSNTTNYLNQGTPSLILINGNWSVIPNPTMDINLSSISPLTVGDSANLYVYGGQAPYQLSFINGNIGTFRPNTTQGNSYYYVKGTNAGKSKIRIVDANNKVDTTDQEIQVVTNRLSLKDTTLLPQNFITIPIRINSLNGAGVFSGTFSFNTDSRLRVDSVILSNTILQNSSVQWNNVNNQSSNTFYLSFANATALSGSGDFVKVRFKVLGLGSIYINFLNAFFNQNTLVATKSASVNFTSVPQLNIFPNGLQMIAGDSVKLTVSGGRKPYQLSVSNVNKAVIDTAYYLKANSSGDVTVSVIDSLGTLLNSNIFKIFDGTLTLPTISSLPNDWVEMPLFMSKLPNGKAINSFQIQLQLNQTQFDSISVTNLNSLSQNFNLLSSYSNGVLNIVAAGANSITQAGILLKLKFKLKSILTIGSVAYIYMNSQLYNEGDVTLKDNSYGTVSVVNQLQKDIRVESVLNLTSSCTKSSAEILQVRIRNLGNFNYFIGDKIRIAYKLNNSNIVYDTLTLNNNLNTNNSVDFTFKNKLNLSVSGQYIIKSFTELPGDINISNDTSSITLQVYGTPNLKLQNDTSICNGNSVTLSSNLIGTYLWSNGSTNNSITVNTSGTYSLIYTNQFNCIAHDTVVVTVLPSQITPTITTSGNLNLCDGDSLLLTTNANSNIQWLRNGIVIPSATSQSIFIKASGNYTVRISSVGFCDAISLPVTVNVFAKPTKPIITSNTNDSLCVGTNSTLQSIFTGTGKWYRNGIEIPNATGTSYIASLPGSYTLKVTNSSNCEAVSDTFKLYYFTNPDTAIITANNTSVCVGDTITLSSNIVPNSSVNLTWYLNNVAIPNSNTQVIKVFQGGSYKVISSNNFGCTSTSNLINLSVNQNPAKPIITSNTNDSLCVGTNSTLQSTFTGTGKWYRNGIEIPNATGTSYIASLPGSYTLKVTNSSNCEAVSDTFKLYYFTNPDTAIITANNTSVCVGDTITLSSNIVPNSSVNLTWYLNNVAIPNSNTQVIKVVQGGSYKVISSNSFGCTSTSNSLNVNFNQKPLIPQITQTGNILTSTVASKYQWYLNDTIIIGANQQSYTITKSGLYKVEVKNQFDCSALSDNFNASFVGLYNIKDQFEIYPNPANDYLIIKTNSYNSDLNLKVYDVLGRLVIEEKITNANYLIDISRLNSGNFTILINQNRFSFIKL